MNTVNLFTADYHPYTGYGYKALMLVKYLSAQGYQVNPLGGDCLIAQALLAPDLIALMNRPIRPALGGIMLGYPTAAKRYGRLLAMGRFIIQTMFESNVLPDGWSEILNRAHAVTVPSRWLVDVMRNCGVETPITVIPEAISEGFQYVDRGDYPEPFTFLALGDRNIRKGWDLAVRAFTLAFGDDPRFRLIIKARAHNKFLEDIFSNPNIEIIRADYTDAEMQALYARVHCFVFPTRGEGFGMPPREAAATGLPVLCTPWSGTADDISAWGIPIRYRMVDAWIGDVHEGCGQWAEADVDDLSAMMQRVASRSFYQQWQGRHVAEAVKRLYSWQSFAEGIASLWEQVNEQEVAHARH